MAIDINRLTEGVVLPKEVSSDIWASTLSASAVLTLGQKTDLPGSGKSIQTITSDPVAEWVDETDEKPVSRPTFGSKVMNAYTLAVIVPFSKQFARDAERLYEELVRRLPAALGGKLDDTVFHGTAPGSGFDVLTAATAVDISSNAYAGVVAADAAVSAAGGIINGYALAPQGRSELLASVDGMGRPLFTNGVESGTIVGPFGASIALSKAAYKAGTPNVVGIAGDWTSLLVGTVEDISVSVSDQATLTDTDGSAINLWQRNMFAVRAEIEVGVAVRDIAHFAKLTA